MKMAVSSVGPDLNASVDARLGRCQYFIIVDPETMEFEALPNPSITAMHGAGIQTAQIITNKGATVVLTGNCGPNAFQTLSAAGIQVIVGVSGTVKDAIEKYKRGELQPSSQASVPQHFGTGGMSPSPGTTPGMGMFPGMGGSPGMGRGGGAGAGRGMGGGMMGGGFQTMPYGTGATPGAPSPMTKNQELQSLKNQAQALSQQLDQI
ncbi:unnamed protein product, partial [marine sediment metagenome]